MKVFLHYFVRVGAIFMFLPIIFAGYILKLYDKIAEKVKNSNDSIYY